MHAAGQCHLCMCACYSIEFFITEPESVLEVSSGISIWPKEITSYLTGPFDKNAVLLEEWIPNTKSVRIVVNQAIDKSLHIPLKLGPYHKIITVKKWQIWLIKMAPGDFGLTTLSDVTLQFPHHISVKTMMVKSVVGMWYLTTQAICLDMRLDLWQGFSGLRRSSERKVAVFEHCHFSNDRKFC